MALALVLRLALVVVLVFVVRADVIGAIDAKVVAPTVLAVADGARVIHTDHKDATPVRVVEAGLLRVFGLVGRRPRVAVAGVLAGGSGCLVLGEDVRDDGHGLVQVARGVLDVEPKVELGHDGIAESARGVNIDLGRHDLRLGAVAHLLRILLVVFSEGIECNAGRSRDAAEHVLRAHDCRPAGEIVVCLGDLLRDQYERRDATGLAGALVVLALLLVRDRFGEVIE